MLPARIPTLCQILGLRKSYPTRWTLSLMIGDGRGFQAAKVESVKSHAAYSRSCPIERRGNRIGSGGSDAEAGGYGSTAKAETIGRSIIKMAVDNAATSARCALSSLRGATSDKQSRRPPRIAPLAAGLDRHRRFGGLAMTVGGSISGVQVYNYVVTNTMRGLHQRWKPGSGNSERTGS